MKIITIVSCQNCPYKTKGKTVMKCSIAYSTGKTIPYYPAIPDWCPLPDNLEDEIDKYEILLKEIKVLKDMIIQMNKDKKV